MQKLVILFCFAIVLQAHSQTEIYHNLLQQHVDNSGNVDYKALKKDAVKLEDYLKYLARTSPEKNWSEAKTKAFWINAYNAYTLQLIIENYPLKSIRNIKKQGKDAWNINFAKVGGKNYTLNHIEHNILRKDFNDPKIHVGVNCASGSCPKLGNFAFTEANYEAKTKALMKQFINDTKRNRISKNKIQISKIFEWFAGDFTKNGSLTDFLNRYSNTKINQNAKISYLEYDWSLNGK